MAVEARELERCAGDLSPLIWCAGKKPGCETGNERMMCEDGDGDRQGPATEKISASKAHPIPFDPMRAVAAATVVETTKATRATAAATLVETTTIASATTATATTVCSQKIHDFRI